MTDHLVELAGQAEVGGGELGGARGEGDETCRRRHARTGTLKKSTKYI